MAAQRDPYEAPAIRAFGIALTTYREAAGLNKTELAEKLGCTPAYVGQIEAAKNMPSRPFAQDLDVFFQTGGLFFRFWKLISDTRHLATIPPGFARYVELEGVANEIRKFEALLIAGLFQTESYARAIMGSLMGPDVIDDATTARVKRKEALFRPNPPNVFLVIDEWALNRIIGSVEIMREQLAHLLELSDRPHINIQILPHDTEHYVAFSGSFSLLKFEEMEPVSYIEAAGQGNLIEETRAVTSCAVRYDLLRGHAYSVPESRKLIRKAMESL
ncbi:helix-turn-helix transcriptional regulator [Actinocorallia lasiicapitis]